MNILITGNLGYVGPVLIKHLRQKHANYRLCGFDTGYYGSVYTGSNFLNEQCLNIQYYGDIRNLNKDILEGIDAVIHLAAISNDPIGNEYEAVTEDINFRASIALAKYAKEYGVKSFAFASSCSVYGSANNTDRTEESELNPLTAYAKSKILTEQGLSELADKNFRITCLRFATACGMSSRLRLDLVLNDFVASVITTGAINILSDGTPWRPLIHVEDMARAFDWAIHRDGGNFLVVNVGSNEWNFQVKNLAETVCKWFPGSSVIVNHEALPDKRSYRVDFSLFKGLAGNYAPQITVDQAIIGLKQGLEETKFGDADFRNGFLMRLNILRQLRKNNLLTHNLEWSFV